MDIRHIFSTDDLESVLCFVRGILPTIGVSEGKYSCSFWLDQMNVYPDLLLYAKDGEVICGSVLGWVDNGTITIGACCVDNTYRGKGIGRSLIVELEKRAKTLGFHSFSLGAVEDAEGFYEKIGFKGALLIQSKEYSIDDLLSLNNTYEVIYTNVYDGCINQVCLKVPCADRELQRQYETIFPGCGTQMVYKKIF